MPVDLARLRALYATSAPDEWRFELGRTWSVLCDELEALRAEVERGRKHPGYIATHNLVRQAYSDERAAIVSWMRVNGTGHLADCIQRGDHHNIGQPTTAPTPIPKCHRCAERDRVRPELESALRPPGLR